MSRFVYYTPPTSEPTWLRTLSLFRISVHCNNTKIISARRATECCNRCEDDLQTRAREEWSATQ